MIKNAQKMTIIIWGIKNNTIKTPYFSKKCNNLH